MLRFSANLGFLWNDMALPDAIRRAKAAGLEAVECHWPYEQDADAVRQALDETGLPMLGINTWKGSREGDFGLAALPDRIADARAAIEQAFAYGAKIGASAVHVMSGRAKGVAGAAETFAENLSFACDQAARHGMMVLIEPINQRDAPGYFLSDVEHAADVVDALGRPELKIMFDCYHTQIVQGDLLRRFEKFKERIGHVQIAAVPSRAEPDEGEVAYERVLAAIDAMGYAGYVGAEYKPRGTTDEGLSWLEAYRRAR